jgi:heterodisulfide reductase subunit A-like polyferredoxin
MNSASTVETPVLVVGAGPAGLIAALQLARHGTPCILVERNPDTTKWPKMDITNCRSMELLTRMGIADGLREVGKLILIKIGDKDVYSVCKNLFTMLTILFRATKVCHRITRLTSCSAQDFQKAERC